MLRTPSTLRSCQAIATGLVLSAMLACAIPGPPLLSTAPSHACAPFVLDEANPELLLLRLEVDAAHCGPERALELWLQGEAATATFSPLQRVVSGARCRVSWQLPTPQPGQPVELALADALPCAPLPLRLSLPTLPPAPAPPLLRQAGPLAVLTGPGGTADQVRLLRRRLGAPAATAVAAFWWPTSQDYVDTGVEPGQAYAYRIASAVPLTQAQHGLQGWLLGPASPEVYIAMTPLGSLLFPDEDHGP